MKITTLDESTIQSIGHAFAYYDYGAEHGLIDAFPNREAVAAFICGYVRMALRGGILHATSEKHEGFIAYKLPGQKIGWRTVKPLAGGMLRSLGLSGVLTVVSRIFAPLVWLLTVSTNGILRAMGLDPDQEEEA